jgi:hypothetical protein
MGSDKQIFIDFSSKNFNFYNNDLFDNLVSRYLKVNHNIDLSNIIEGNDLTNVCLEVLNNDLSNVKNRNALYHIIEEVYDYWREHKRYLISDMTISYSINESNYHDLFNSFNKMVLDSYRKVCSNLLGKSFKIMRELAAGGNAFILLDRCNYQSYEVLNDVPFIHSVIFRPPFMVYSKSNKRKGIFPIISENPINNLTVNKGEWFCYPILVGKKRVFVYFKSSFMAQGLALSNLFEHDDDYQNNKPDIIVVFGGDTKDGIYYDEEKELYVASLVERDEIDYFGYMKKLVLTVYNIQMIKNKCLPIHGACVTILLNNGTEKNVVLVGDSGAGKSETLEALRKIGQDYVLKMTTIFDDMGTFVLDSDGLKAYGTEIGAFVRTDDLGKDYTYKVFDRAIFMNPTAVNARIVLPVASYDDITEGVKIDALYYANNYGVSEEKIKVFKDKDEALNVFRTGARVAKGTTGENGFVTTFFANPFGPVQLQEETDELLKIYFDYLFESGVEVGEIYTGLALENAAENPAYAAKELLEKLK